jgi:signal transduction histidine kinase/CheY-like chemotaxis protein
MLCRSAIEIFAANNQDCMLSMVYTGSGPTPRCVYTVNKETGVKELAELTLHGDFCIEPNHPKFPDRWNPDNEKSNLMSAFKRVCELDQRLVLKPGDGILPADAFAGARTLDNEPVYEVVVEPLRDGDNNAILGFLVLGTSSMTETNERYLDFVATAARVLGSWLSSLLGRKEVMDCVDRETKEEKLNIQLREVKQQMESQGKILEHFANGTNIGMVMASYPHGDLVYRNRRFNDIHELDESDDVSITEVGERDIDPEFLPEWTKAWAAVMLGKKVTVDLRLKQTWTPPQDEGWVEEEEKKMWIRLEGFPDVDFDGKVNNCMGSVTDFSELKWREEYQKRLTKDANDARKRIENFIDSTNHELRNPLSAIWHAAEDILRTTSSTLPGSDAADALPPEIHELVNDVAEDGTTIMRCARHQKHIIDDVLEASRLDSGLVRLCPVVADPEDELRASLDMCRFESIHNCVDVSVTVADSYRRHATSALILDATRFKQVCMNLLLNAIKFSGFEPVKTVTVTLEATDREPQANETFGVAYFDRLPPAAGDLQQLVREEAEWGTGASVYLCVTVADTGRGVSEAEQQNLFTRYGQASPRTHSLYGGSGLGLFVSRRLAERQGGRIGFRSAVGRGSTFSFYIRARRATGVLALRDTDWDPSIAGEDVTARLLRKRKAVDENEAAANGGPVGGEPAAPRGGRCAAAGESAPAKGVRHALALAALLEGQAPAIPVSVAPRAPRAPQSLAVMVVEDNELNQRLMTKGLRKMGVKVLVASNGVEALELLRGTRWFGPAVEAAAAAGDADAKPPGELTCMLLDWEMPVMDGLTCVREIRAMEARGEIGGHLPVLGLTANARPAQLEKATEAGMVCFLRRFWMGC